jgi:diadenosine tetraphosphate (Ap4A) HIT family hydrolase
MADCVFCKIIAHEIPAEVIFENDQMIVIKDIHPQAEIHFLVITKKHIRSLAAVEACDRDLLANILLKISTIARDYCPNNAYHVETIIGSSWGQTVDHLHFHILGGKRIH